MCFFFRVGYCEQCEWKKCKDKETIKNDRIQSNRVSKYLVFYLIVLLYFTLAWIFGHMASLGNSIPVTKYWWHTYSYAKIRLCFFGFIFMYLSFFFIRANNSYFGSLTIFFRLSLLNRFKTGFPKWFFFLVNFSCLFGWLQHLCTHRSWL